MSYLPTPLEWHPAYREWDKTALIHWLNDPHSWYRRIPIPLRISFSALLADETDLMEMPEFKELMLTKHKMYGWAPYVGDPFIYMWFAAVDQFGRWIAGESWIEYLPDRVMP